MSHQAVLSDEQGNRIGLKDRYEVLPGESIIITVLWVVNSKGEILLAKRSHLKKNSPNLWGPSASGTVEPDETFESNVTKEAHEEIGLSGLEPVEINRFHYWSSDGTGRYVVWYKTVVDRLESEFVLQKEEVDAVRWITAGNLLDETAAHPEMFTSTTGIWAEAVELLR